MAQDALGTPVSYIPLGNHRVLRPLGPRILAGLPKDRGKNVPNLHGARFTLHGSELVRYVEVTQIILALDLHAVVAVIIPPHNNGVVAAGPSTLAVKVEGLAEVFILGLRDLNDPDFFGSKFHGSGPGLSDSEISESLPGLGDDAVEPLGRDRANLLTAMTRLLGAVKDDAQGVDGALFLVHGSDVSAAKWLQAFRSSVAKLIS